MQTTINVIPALRYRDAETAIEWLCEAFGFTEHLVVPGGAGMIAHAQLTYKNGMIMLGSARDDDFGRLVAPIEKGKPATVGIHLVVKDVDAHHAQALKSGAEIVTPPEDQDYGGRFYSCRDLEGNVWSFGTYDPMA
ncbi:MAG: VOC family protein [Acidobacteria bacterium]|nr:VOC family protein [Acidobacteriota bacterium]MDA1234808.1 VOC family protein [Acidobacteriota bacterium]